MMTLPPTSDDYHKQPANHQEHNNPPDFFTTTTLTNSGIIDRLQLDIADYLSTFGFSLKRHVGCESGSGCKQHGNGRCNAVLTVQQISNNRKGITDEIICSNGSFCAMTNWASAANPAAISSLIPLAGGPMGTLHLTIHDDASLLATVGPLLRTYLRLSPHHMHPLRLRAVIHCKFTLDALEKLAKMSLEQRLDHLNRQEEINARRMTHHLHMLVRNSMGSALCLKLVVVLPWYWRRKLLACKGEGGDSPCNRTKVALPAKSVQMATRENPDACYPTIQLVEQCNTSGMTDDQIFGYDYGPTTLCLHVQTRMCTVRHQPLLFRWISSWQDSTIAHPCQITMHSKSPRLKGFPLIVACIEKVGNLHRVLMILHDHDEKYRNINETSEHLFSNELIIIMPTSTNDKKDKTRCNFDHAIDNFYQVVIGEKQGGQQHEDWKASIKRPTLVNEEDAAEIISEMAFRRQSSASTRALPEIVGIDLHPDALTLKGDYATAAPLSPALQTMRDADAIIFGYESTGIPNILASRLLNSWVQIPSRSSINVVAAMSIVLDALAWS